MFQLSFLTLLMVVSSVAIVAEQQHAFSQLSEQDNNSATQSPGFLTYANATYGITIQYPSNWMVDNTEFPGDPLIQIVGFFFLLRAVLIPMQKGFGLLKSSNPSVKTLTWRNMLSKLSAITTRP